MSDYSQRFQQTIARPVKVSGFGLFGGVDVSLEFCPADPDHGIVFERTDLSSPVQIPAVIENVVPQPRCTVIATGDVSVSVIEHVMAALAGLQVDNCLIRINAPEPPACDGSSRVFVEALLSAGIVVQGSVRQLVIVNDTVLIAESEQVGIVAQSPHSTEFEIGFIVDYGAGNIPRQALNLKITPRNFVEELCMCRTFVEEAEVKALQANGIGQRATTKNVLVFGDEGLIDNSLRFRDECVRHKILDCIGDFALLGCDLRGRFTATQSGHRLNHALIRQIKEQHLATEQPHTVPFPKHNPQSNHRIAG